MFPNTLEEVEPILTPIGQGGAGGNLLPHTL